VSDFEFVEATKEQAKARVALAGPTGSGKTWTSMVLATVFSQGEKFAVIDTERGSASKYVGPFRFQRLNMYEYDPRDLIKAIAAADRQGFPCLVVDSLSRFWSGKGGMLEFVDNVSKRNYNGNTFGGGWKEARPIENDMIEAMLGFSGHLIVTMRTKTHYDVTKNDRGQTVPVKIGLQPEQRQGIEYEFDIVGDMDIDNNLTVSKTRCPDLAGRVYNRPGPAVAQTILTWLEDGVKGTSATEYRDRALDPSLSFADLGQLKQEVRAAGKLLAMVQDDHGDVVTLDALINRRGVEARGGHPAEPQARQPAPHAPQSAAPAPGSNSHAGSGDGQESAPVPPPLDPEDSWAVLIADVKTPEDADNAETQLGKAFDDGEVTAERAAQIAHWLRVKAAPMRTAARSVPPAGNGSDADRPADDRTWVAGFLAELTETPLDGLTKMRGKLGRAVAERRITAEEASMLAGEVTTRKKYLEDAAEQAGAPDVAA
jgi:AAA domain